ncbi:MAG: DsrE family protein [Desulfobacteraceae bacterium]
MKITVLLKSGPFTAEADRALRSASDMLAMGHSVHLYLLQDAVNFCRADIKDSSSQDMGGLIDEKLKVYVLIQDAGLRGIDVDSVSLPVSGGDYESIVELVESSDRVIGLL